MIIDALDLKLLRHLEAQGTVPIDDIINKFHTPKEEIFLRIKNFEDEGLIFRYGIKFFIPLVTGGRWLRGCAFVDAEGEIDFSNRIPLLEEVIENITVPQGIMPNKSLLFYARDLKECYKILNRTPGVRYAEIYKIGEYDIPSDYELSKEEWHLISQIFNSNLNFKRIIELTVNPKSDDDIRLSRMILHKGNRRGFISVIPEINWGIIKNFTHIHIAITTKLTGKNLKKLLKKIGCTSNIPIIFKKRYLQIESDLWGFSDFQNIISLLKNENKIILHGFSLACRNRIFDEWIKELALEKAQ
uniref:Lrp/AsnC family transcriptional regulator n=1 Tax=candidate division WOR-3 bacterium TaxID=2052148 RepID=A0A7C4TJJ0_UNCW3